ncbi:hypothetical protein ATANTOWER_000323 [Ataeniobius toweri]|uniref:Uncharacterized protein n=1 Tax=Ataeniobius toweri TaxID=208326 RepID=A0ABU7A3R6_9TELE|nr:hypothetical protein [Ataeniobius toweri]
MERKMEENTDRDVEAGSETGGEDALVGNVNKLTVSPPGYTGPLRKGHLIFDACFESVTPVLSGGMDQQSSSKLL